MAFLKNKTTSTSARISFPHSRALTGRKIDVGNLQLIASSTLVIITQNLCHCGCKINPLK